MTEATPSVRPIIENTGATATAAAETLMKTIAMDGNRINIPIDVRQVAERLGLEVQYLLLDSGTDGMIVKEAGRPCKVVVDALAHTHRRRFTLAHEIGHYVQKYQKYALGDEGGESTTETSVHRRERNPTSVGRTDSPRRSSCRPPRSGNSGHRA